MVAIPLIISIVMFILFLSGKIFVVVVLLLFNTAILPEANPYFNPEVADTDSVSYSFSALSKNQATSHPTSFLVCESNDTPILMSFLESAAKGRA